jgi:exodeoxyribonuclease VII large subunit
VISALSVSQLTKYIKGVFDNDELLQSVWIKGEISNYTLHASGHQYFTLKDDGASLRCVKFKYQGYAPDTGKFKAGDKVLVHGTIDLYPPQGSYQLRVTQIHLQGLGDLYQQFVHLKSKLEAEGLFDISVKKSLPRFPKVIGVISSATGAVIQDIRQTISRRFPSVILRLAPAMMQGEMAAMQVMDALERLEAQKDIDIIIIARGGGSMEDLWCFNDERLIRAIFKNSKPVISAIGHETDFTLCDFVADLRAPTPTAAAELSVPDRAELISRLKTTELSLNRNIRSRIAYYQEHLDNIVQKLEDNFSGMLQRKWHKLQLLSVKVEHADPLLPLEKGFTLTLKDGMKIKSSEELKAGDTIETRFTDGSVKSTVSE